MNVKRFTAAIVAVLCLTALCSCNTKEGVVTTAPSAPESFEQTDETISVTVPVVNVADKDAFAAELEEFGGISCEEIEDAYLLTMTASTYDAFMAQKRQKARAAFDEGVQELTFITNLEMDDDFRIITVTVTPGEYTKTESRPVLADAATNFLAYQLYTGENLFVTVKVFDTAGEVVDSFQLPAVLT